MIPKINSMILSLVRYTIGSIIAVKKLTADKQTSPTDTFEYFMDAKNKTQCIEANIPMPNILALFLTVVFENLFVIVNKIKSATTVNNNRYQTIKISFILINLPSTPVKPANNTAI